MIGGFEDFCDRLVEPEKALEYLHLAIGQCWSSWLCGLWLLILVFVDWRQLQLFSRINLFHSCQGAPSCTTLKVLFGSRHVVQQNLNVCLVFLAKKTVKTLQITWRFFHSVFTFLPLNKLLYFLLTVTEILLSGNLGHVVLLSFGLFFLFWTIKLAFAVALFVARTKEVSVC